MAQQILNNNSTANNDGNGDTPPVFGEKCNNNFTELYNLTVSLQDQLNQVPDNFVEVYWFDDNDLNTATAPIPHTGGSTTTWLTNDSAGTSTNAYNPNNNDKVWNENTNLFDFTSLKIGDTVEVRVDINVTTTAANQELDILMSLAGGGYELDLSHRYYKTASTGPLTTIANIYIGDEATRTGGARFRFSSDNNATIMVNGWYSKVTSV